MKQLINFLRNLKYRYKVTIFLCLVILLCIPILQQLLLDGNNNIYRELFNAVGSVTASVLAAALFAVAIEFSDVRKSITENSAFREFFNIQGKERPYIILPRFESKENSTGLEDIMWLSFNDVIALRHLSSMFAEYHAPAPRIIFDSDINEILYGKLKNTIRNEQQKERYEEIAKAKAFISIGVYSNEVSKKIIELSNDEDSYFFKNSIAPCLYSYDTTKSNRNYLSIPHLNEKNILSWHTKNKTKKPEQFEHQVIKDESTLTLLSRININNGKSIFVLGGIESRGTRKTASYLRRNWKIIRDIKEAHRNTTIGNKPFSILFRQSFEPQVKPDKIATYYSDTIT